MTRHLTILPLHRRDHAHATTPRGTCNSDRGAGCRNFSRLPARGGAFSLDILFYRTNRASVRILIAEPLTGQSLQRDRTIPFASNRLSRATRLERSMDRVTGQSTCLFNRFAHVLGEVTIGRSTGQISSLRILSPFRRNTVSLCKNGPP
jgi:hypothetical protein